MKAKILKQIIPLEEANYEWTYLVNETLEGEKCIVPLLREILANPVVKGALADDIKRQLDEEAQHVRLFYGLVGKDRISGSGYRQKLYTYVQSLPNLTLKLFSLQALLEGFALGSLKHRLSLIENSPSQKVDEQAYAEELNHVMFSYKHFGYLKQVEGEVSDFEFRKTTRDVNSILSGSFNGENLKAKFLENFGVNIENPESLVPTEGMRQFRETTIKHVIKNKNSFINAYKKAENA